MEDVKTFHQCVVCDEIFERYEFLETHNKIHVKVEKTDHFDNQNDKQDGEVEIGYVENVKDEKPDRVVSLDGSDGDNLDQSKGDNSDQNKRDNPDDQNKMLVKQETINEAEQFEGFRTKTNHTNIFVEGEETYLVGNRIHMKYVIDAECMTNASQQCTVCSEHFKQHLGLEEHCKIRVKEEENTTHQFKECEISCRQYLDVEEQFNSTVDEDDSITNASHQCTFCKENFKQFIDLQQHNCTKTDLNQLSPSDDVSLGEKLRNKSDWPCSICHRSFSWKCRLQKHMKHHTGDKPDVCGKSFTLKSNLGSHVKIHTGDQPFKCDVCGKSFSQKSNLRAHIKIHTGDKAFKCNVCSKSFTLKSNLQQHIRTHTGDQPFKCYVCGKSFSQKCSQKKHIRTHFKCSACRISFSSGDQLTKHTKIHNGERWVKIRPKYENNKN